MAPDPKTAEDRGPAEAAKAFEAVFLSQFVDGMLKSTSASAFGGQQQAEMWRSFMAEALAEELVEQGGLGLASNVEQQITAYNRASALAKEE